MGALSTPREPRSRERTEATRIAIEDVVVRYAIPAIIALLFVFMLVLEGRQPSWDLTVVTPEAVAPGSTLPVRATVVRGLDRLEGPEPVAANVRVELRAGVRTIVRAVLDRSAVLGSEGTFAVPADVTGTITLVARTDGDHGGLLVQRTIPVSAHPPRSVPVARQGVEASVSHGPVEALSVGPVPSELELRIEGGLCVPELPCRVLVWVGEPAATVRFEPSGPVEIVPMALSQPTTGIVEGEVVVHGPAPGVFVIASRDGVDVARREIALPITMGGISARVEPRLVASGERPEVRVAALEGDTAVEVDVFREGGFVATTSFDAQRASRGTPLLVPLGAGLHRIQMRRDAFSLDGSAEAFVLVGGDLHALARDVDARRTDLLAHALVRGTTLSDTPDDRIARFLLAPDEAEIVPLPEGVSSSARAEEERKAVARRSRRTIAELIVFLGLVSAAIVLRRGLAARDDELALLREAEIEVDEAATRRRATRTAVLAALLVLFGFGIAAALVLSRGLV